MNFRSEKHKREILNGLNGENLYIMVQLIICLRIKIYLSVRKLK